MNQTFQLLLGPKMLLPAVSLAVCYRLCRMGSPDWKYIPTKRLCGYKSFLPVNDPPTAKWASDHFGDQELLEYRVSHSEI